MTQTMTRPDTQDRKTAALAAYLDSRDAGDPLTGKQLGERFGRSERWGRDVIAAAPSAAVDPDTTPDTTPAAAPTAARQSTTSAAAAPVDQDPAGTPPAAATTAADPTAAADPVAAPTAPTVPEPTPDAGRIGPNPTQSAPDAARNARSALPGTNGHPRPPRTLTADSPATAAGPAVDAAAGLPLTVAAAATEDPAAAAPSTTAATTAARAPAAAVDGPADDGKPERTGRAVAWTAFLVGITASVAANVMHAATPDKAGSATDPELVGAAFWPLALLLAVEVLTRVSWPRGFWWAVARFGGVGLPAGVAAVISYNHMHGLLTSWGESPLNAAIGPLSVDGLMLISATALLAIGPRRKTARA